MSKLIVVVGATGSQGGSVVRTFLEKPGWKVRGITRDPSRASSQPLKDAGVELVAGDLDDVDSLVAAFTGATAIFGVTDFWQFPANKAVQEDAKKRGVRINEACMDAEIFQFKNIITAAAKVLKAEGKLERFVMSTLSDTRKWSNGTITENYHFDGKAMATEWLKTSSDPDLQALNKRTSWVQIGFYMDNMVKMGVLKPYRSPDGKSLILPSISRPPHTNGTPMVHPPADTGVYVEALVEHAPAGSVMLGTSKMMAFPDFVTLLSEKWGLPVEMKSLSKEDLLGLAGEDWAGEYNASAEYVRNFGYDGGDPEVKKPWELGVDISRLMSPEQYVKTTDWSELLKA